MNGKFVFLGTWYDVELKDTAAEIDGDGRKALHAQIDMWDKICRIYRFKQISDTKKTWMHEIVHLIVDFMNSKSFDPPDAEIDQFADLWFDTLERNNLLVKDWSHVLGVK